MYGATNQRQICVDIRSASILRQRQFCGKSTRVLFVASKDLLYPNLCSRFKSASKKIFKDLGQFFKNDQSIGHHQQHYLMTSPIRFRSSRGRINLYDFREMCFSPISSVVTQEKIIPSVLRFKTDQIIGPQRNDITR